MDNLTTGQIVAITIIAVVNVVLLVLAFYIYISNEKREKKLYELEREKKRKLEEELAKIERQRKIEKQEEMVQDYQPEIKQSEPKPVKSETSQIDFEAVLEKLQEAVENENNRSNMNKYEEDQEEDAIISYQQLVEAHNKQIEEPKEDAVISYKELMKVHNDEPTYKEEPKRTYTGTEFISPVFGRQPYTAEYRNLRETQYDLKPRTVKVEEISDEVRKNDEFLRTLKDFRKNL